MLQKRAPRFAKRSTNRDRVTYFPYFIQGSTCATLLLVMHFAQGAPLMEWVTPQHEEIDLNCEISSYANAEL
jgi:hypothetical protein